MSDDNLNPQRTFRQCMDDYRGMHYPSPVYFGWPRLFYSAWRYWMCCREFHLLSEVCSSAGPNYHYLVCDACQLIVNIESIDTTYSNTPPTNRGE